MRSLYLILFISFFACSNSPINHYDIVLDNLLELNKSLDDPDSYEFVSLELLDSITYQDNINYRLKELDVKKDKKRLQEDLRLADEFPSLMDTSMLNYKMNEIQRNEKMIAEIRDISVELRDTVNHIASYLYLYNYRSNNKLGAKVLNTYYAQTDHELNVINIAKDKDGLFLNPNQFPHYVERVKKYF